MNKIRGFAKKNVLLFSVLLAVMLMLLYNYAGAFVPIKTEYQVLSLPLSAFKAVLAVIVMLFLIFFDYCGTEILQFKNIKKSLTIISPVAAIIIVEFLLLLLSSYQNVTFVNFIRFIIGLLAIGIFEEFVFRVGVLQILLSKWRYKEKGLENAALVSGIIFGCAHATNIFSGNASLYVIGQCVLAAVMGYFLSILYIITKNIWGCVLFHATFDCVSTFGLVFGNKTVSSSISSVQYTLGNNSDNNIKDVLMVIGFYAVVIAFSVVMYYAGKKLLYFSEEIKKQEEKTKTDEYLEKLLEIEPFPERKKNEKN